MSDMNFEHIRQTLLETQEFEYRPEDWEALDRVLRPRRKKGLFFILLFAGIGVLVSGAVLSQMWGGVDKTEITAVESREQTKPKTDVVNDLVEKNETLQTLSKTVDEQPGPIENVAISSIPVVEYKSDDIDERLLPPVVAPGYEIQEDLYAAGEVVEKLLEEKDNISIEAPVFLPMLVYTVKNIEEVELPAGEISLPKTAEAKRTSKIHGRIAVGLTYQPGQSEVFPGNDRTPKAAGQSVQALVPLNEKNMVGLQLRSQRSFSYHDSLLVEVANQYYPDWSDDFELFYDSLDVAQKSLTLDLTYYRTVFNKHWGKIHLGLGGRFSLKRDQRVDTVIKNIYLGRLAESHNVSFSEVFKGVVPELLIDVPLYKGLGVSFGMEYAIPVSKEAFDIEPQLSGFGRLYYEF